MTFSATTIAQNVGIGNTTFTPNASSLLELRSTSSGFLMPRMTEAQRDAISSPATGLMIYQTNNTPGYYYYDGSSWQSFGASIDNLGDHTASQNLVVGTGLGMTDTDEDTKVQVEKVSDEDQIRFDVAGSEAMMISSGQNVGVGTSNPTEKLHVDGNIRVGVDAYFDDDATAGGNSDDWIRLNGFVEVKSNTDNQGLVIRDKDNNDYAAITQKNGYSYFSDSNTSSDYFLRGNGSNVDVKGDLRVMGSDIYDNSGTLRLSGEDEVYITMDYNNNDNNNRSIRFGKNNMSSPTELMRIDEDGNVGVGTSSPQNLLDVAGTTETESLKVTDGATNGYVLTSDASGNATWQAPASGSGNMADDDADTKIQVEESTDEDMIRFDVAGNEAMVIDNSGKVGIGTDEPSRSLQVQTNSNGTNFPLFLRNKNGTHGSNGVGIAFNSEQNGDWIKAGIFHERTANYGVGKLHFLVDNVSDNGSVSLSESRMTISPQGNVGIGTTSPDRALHVRSTASNVNVVTVQNTQSNGWSSIDFHNQSGSLSATFGYANSGTSGIFTGKAYMNSYDNDFVLTRNSSENSIFIEGSSGDIGFNTNNPTARLDVNGDARIRDLAGSGTRMVVTDANGNLSTQAIPGGGGGDAIVIGNKMTLHLTNDVSSLNVSGVSYLLISTNSSSNEIKGFSGGVDGQMLYIINQDSGDDIKIKKNQGSQQTREDVDVKKKEGRILMYNGSHWYCMSKE